MFLADSFQKCTIHVIENYYKLLQLLLQNLKYEIWRDGKQAGEAMNLRISLPIFQVEIVVNIFNLVYYPDT